MAKSNSAGTPAAVTLSASTKTMSSLEIAKLMGKAHRNVLADIRKTLEEAQIDLLKFQQIETFANNRIREVFNLPRLECDLLISGYSVKYRLAIIKRWIELETGSASTIPANTAQALSAANAVAAQVQAAVFEQLMTGQGRMDHGRWIVSFANGRAGALLPSVAPVESGAVVMTLPYLAAALVEPGGMMPSNTDLANLAAACNKRLAQRLEYAESSARTVQKGASHV